MAGNNLEHQENVESLDMIGKYSAERGGAQPGVGNILHIVGPGGAFVQLGVVGHVSSDR